MSDDRVRRRKEDADQVRAVALLAIAVFWHDRKLF